MSFIAPTHYLDCSAHFVVRLFHVAPLIPHNHSQFAELEDLKIVEFIGLHLKKIGRHSCSFLQHDNLMPRHKILLAG